MQLDYFSGDYVRGNTNIASFNAIGSAATPVPTLYSGHIATQTWFSQKSASAVAIQGAQINAPQSATYQYDNRYQLAQASFAVPDFANRLLQPQEKYKEYGLTYDWHGNLKSLKRNDATGALKDDFTYTYRPNTNQLQGVSGYRSYQYDPMGQMSAETGNGQANYIEYDANGKVNYIYQDEGGLRLKCSFHYNEAGERFKKVDHENGSIAYYVYGRDGLLATYLIENDQAVLQELPIYGLKALGSFSVKSRKTTYELSNHTGNVLAVIGRDKINGVVNVFSYNDFTALGAQAGVGGDQENGYGYQGAYSGQDEQTGWNVFELRMYDSRIGRWLSTDPYQQYWSPYVGMGNDWVNQVDPNGGQAEWKRDGKGNLIAEKGDNLSTLHKYFDGKYSMDELTQLVNNLSNWDEGMTASKIHWGRFEGHKLNILPLANIGQAAGAQVYIAANALGEVISDNVNGLKALTTKKGWKDLGQALFIAGKYLSMTDDELHKKIDYAIYDNVTGYFNDLPKKTRGEITHDAAYAGGTVASIVYGPKVNVIAKEAFMSTGVGQKLTTTISPIVQNIKQAVKFTPRAAFPVYVSGISFGTGTFAQRIKAFTNLLNEIEKLEIISPGTKSKFLNDFKDASEAFFAAMDKDISLLSEWKKLDGLGLVNLKKSTAFLGNKKVLHDLGTLTEETKNRILRALDQDADLLAELNKNPVISKAWTQHKQAVSATDLEKSTEAVLEIENLATRQKALALIEESTQKQLWLERMAKADQFQGSPAKSYLEQTFGEEFVSGAQVELKFIDNTTGRSTTIRADYLVKDGNKWIIIDAKFTDKADDLFKATESFTDNQKKVVDLLNNGNVRSIEVRASSTKVSDLNLQQGSLLNGNIEFVVVKSQQGSITQVDKMIKVTK